MDKKEYGRIMLDLFNKKFQIKDLLNIKKNANLEEILKALPLMYKNVKILKMAHEEVKSYNNIIFPRVPSIFTGQFREEILLNEIVGELRFLTGQIVIESKKIKEFFLVKNEFECLFMSGQFEKALRTVEKFENDYGLSFWYLDSKIVVLSHISPCKADEYCNDVINSCDNFSVKTFVKIERYRFLKDVTMPYFNAKFDEYFHKYDEKEKDSNFKEAFKRYLVMNVDIARGMDLNNIMYLLLIGNYIPIFDRYIILEKVLGWLCSETIIKGGKIKNCILECALLLRKKLDIPFWSNVCNLMGNYDEILINEDKIIINNGLKLLYMKKYTETFCYCEDMLKKLPNNFSLINIMAKCRREINKSTPYLELAWFIKKLYSKEEKNTEFTGIIGLCDVFERIYSFFSFGNNLGVIIENETRPIMLQGKVSYINALISLNFTPSKLAFFLRDEKNVDYFLNEYKRKIGVLYFSDWQIATYSETNKKMLSNYACDNTSYVLNDIQNIDSDLIHIWDELDTADTDSFNVQVCRAVLLKKHFDLAVNNNQLLDAIDIYIKAFFVSQWMVLKIDCNKINEKITRKTKNFLENYLSYCLYAYITHFELYKGENISETVVNSYKKIVDKNGGTIVDFVIPDEKLEKQKVIFFMRYICTYEGLRRVKIGMSLVQELYNDRLQIIDKILPYYEELNLKEDINALTKERKEVYTKIEYLDIAKCINKGKINTSWVVFSDEAQGAIMSIYNMHQSMEENYTFSAYVNAFVLVKKDYVQEINRILSITIRHGILEGELLRFVKKGKISEDMECISPITKLGINIFYAKIYGLIEKLLDEFVICTYKYESENKLLLFVEEELLGSSFNELPENIDGPEDIEEIYTNILNNELEKKLPEWGNRICSYIDKEMRQYLKELFVFCDDDLRININKISDLLGGEIEKLKEWFAVTENQEVNYRLVTLGDVLEQEWEYVSVISHINKDVIVTGNVINFLYTIFRELIWNAEKYSGYKNDSDEFYIDIHMYMEAENIIFEVINNIEKDVTLQDIEKNIKELGEIIKTVEKSDAKIFNRKDIREGKSGYKKIVKLLKRSYDGRYQIGVKYEERKFIVKMSLAWEALT